MTFKPSRGTAIVLWACLGSIVASIMLGATFRRDPHFTNEFYVVGFVFLFPATVAATALAVTLSNRISVWLAIAIGGVAAPLTFAAYVHFLLQGYEFLYWLTIPSVFIAMLGVLFLPRFRA